MNKNIALFLLLSTTVMAGVNNIKSFVLQNGLQAILVPDFRAPIINVQVWYKVGASFESNGSTGISHALEHMMFRGTSKFPNYNSSIADLGGKHNAFTSHDFTAYYQIAPKENLEKILELEADRMVNLQITKDLFVKEMAAILEERRMRVDDAPMGLAMERFMALAFLSNPYHNPIIGWEGDIKQYTVEDAIGWYKKWYAPNNAIIVIAGDIDEGEAKRLVSKHFSLLKSRQLPKVKNKKSQPIISNKKIYLSQPVSRNQLVIGYKVPSILNIDEKWHFYALDILSELLAKNIADDLQQKHGLISKSSVSCNNLKLYDDLFIVDLTLNSGIKYSAVEQSFINIITRMKLHPVSQDKLKAIKAKVASSYVFMKDSLNDKALTAGFLAALGLPLDFSDKYVENVNNITAEQLQQVVQLYFKKNIMMYVRAKGSRLL